MITLYKANNVEIIISAIHLNLFACVGCTQIIWNALLGQKKYQKCNNRLGISTHQYLRAFFSHILLFFLYFATSDKETNKLHHSIWHREIDIECPAIIFTRLPTIFITICSCRNFNSLFFVAFAVFFLFNRNESDWGGLLICMIALIAVIRIHCNEKKNEWRDPAMNACVGAFRWKELMMCANEIARDTFTRMCVRLYAHQKSLTNYLLIPSIWFGCCRYYFHYSLQIFFRHG